MHREEALAVRITLAKASPAYAAELADRLAQVLVNAEIIEVQGTPQRGRIVLDREPAEASTCLGQSIEEWLSANKTNGVCVEVSCERDEELPTLPARTPGAGSRSWPRHAHLYADLWALPTGSLEDVRIREDRQALELVLSVPSRPKQQVMEDLATLAEGWCCGWDVILEVASGDEGRDVERRRPGPMVLVPHRVLGLKASQPVRDFMDADEETWRGTAPGVFGKAEGTSARLEDEGTTTCLVDPFPGWRVPLRSLLPIYDRVNFVTRSTEMLREAMHRMEVSEPEFDELFRRGRVGVVLPHGWHRYEPRVLDRLIALNPDALIGPRTIAAYVARDYRTRHPLTYARLPLRERTALITGMVAAADEYGARGEVGWKALALATAAWHDRSWGTGEAMFSRRGVSASGSHGLGWWVSETRRRMGHTGGGFAIDLLAESVEMSSALGAVLVESEHALMKQGSLAELIALFHGGAVLPGTNPSAQELEMVVEDLLAVRTDIPVLAVASAFESDDIRRFRRLVHGLLRGATDARDLRQEVARLNREVAKFNGAPAAFRSGLIKGVGSTGLQQAAMAAFGPAWFAPIVWLVLKAASPLVRLPRDDAGQVGEVIDRIEAGLKGAEPTAPLLARMRSQAFAAKWV